MAQIPHDPAARPGSRRFLHVAAAVLLAAVLWSGLWWLAAARAAVALDGWIGREAAQGRQWTCPDRRIEGYPFAVRLRCSKPVFRGEVAGRIATGSVEGLRAGVGLGAPRTVAVDLTGPLHLRAEDDAFHLIVSWDTLRLSAGALPGAPRDGTLEADRLAVTLDAPARAPFNLRAARLSGWVEPAAEAGAGDAAFTFAASDVSTPTLDALAGDADALGSEGAGVLRRADLLSRPTVAQLEAWRAAGGRLDVERFALTRGTFRGEAAGTLALDDGHRAAGRLDTALQGFEPLAKRFGIPIAGIRIGGLIGSLFGGAAAPPATGPDVVRLPLVLADGHVAVGPVQMPLRLDPLY